MLQEMIAVIFGILFLTIVICSGIIFVSPIVFYMYRLLNLIHKRMFPEEY